MKKVCLLKIALIILLITSLPRDLRSQQKWQPWINAGYLTALQPGEDSYLVDNGFSARIGLFNRGLFGNGRFGFYVGYISFTTYYEDYVEYDDLGKLLVAGVDYMLLKNDDLSLYASFGLAREKLISQYAFSEETETSLKPDFGIILNYKFFNLFTGFQPAGSPHLNIGIGFTLYKTSAISNSDY